MTIDGERMAALVDTGCSLTLIGERAAGTRCFDSSVVTRLEMMNGDDLVTKG